MGGGADACPDAGIMLQGELYAAPLMSYPPSDCPVLGILHRYHRESKALSSCRTDMTTTDTCSLFRVPKEIGGKRELILV